LARYGAWPRGRRVGSPSVLRHGRCCFSECKIRCYGSSLGNRPGRWRRRYWLGRWRGGCICPFAEFVSGGRIPIRQLLQPNDRSRNFHPDRERSTRWRELPVLACDPGTPTPFSKTLSRDAEFQSWVGGLQQGGTNIELAIHP